MALRLSATLCLALLVSLALGLYHWTLGFEVWTFEGRRQARVAEGALRAPVVALTGIDGRPLQLWTAAPRMAAGPLLPEAGAPVAPVATASALAAATSAPAAYLVDFIYTRCASICLALGSEYQQMQRALAAAAGNGEAAGVRLVSISFDLAHDDARQLAHHAALLRADPAHWTFAVPSDDAAARTLLGALGVVVVPDGRGDFVHNGAIHLLDRHGRLRGLFAPDQWQQALAAARQLAALPRGAQG